MPFPEGAACTIQGAALALNRAPQTIYNMLSLHADRFGPAIYQRRGDGCLVRILTEHDLTVLRSLFTVYVKRKVTSR